MLILILFCLAVTGLFGFIIGNSKGRGLLGLCLGVLLGPIGWILVLCLGDAGAECAMCRKAIDERATICPYCRSVVVTEPPIVAALPFVKNEPSFSRTVAPHKPAA